MIRRQFTRKNFPGPLSNRRLGFEALEGRRLFAVGELDTSFGDEGTALVSFELGRESDDRLSGVVVQSDGKIVSVGTVEAGAVRAVGLSRTDAEGNLDASFGEEGSHLFFVPSSLSIIKSAVVQPDDKIVVLIEDSYRSIVVLRFQSDGLIDPSFGEQGIARFEVPVTISCNDLALQPDGKIVVAGSVTRSSNLLNVDNDPILVRFNSNGSIDSAFGEFGAATQSITEVLDIADAAWVQADGKLLVAGASYFRNDTTTPEDDRWDLFVARFESDGSPDLSFADQGQFKLPTTNGQMFFAGKRADVLTDVDGNISLISSQKNQNGNFDFSITRLTDAGSLDTTFGEGGTQLSPVGFLTDDVANQAIVLKSGKIVILGTSNFIPTLARFNADWTLDQTFSADGVFSPFPNYSPIAVAEHLDSSLIVVAETVRASVDFTLSRVLENGTMDLDFGKTVTNFRDNVSIAAGRSVIRSTAGGFLVAGNCAAAIQSDTCLAKLTDSGELDPEFGSAGRIRLSRDSRNESLELAELQDGKFLVVVASYDSDTQEYVLRIGRYLPSGIVDSDFGEQGWARLAIPNMQLQINDLLVQHDGGILLNVSRQVVSGPYVNTQELIRLNPDGSIDETFATAGRLEITNPDANFNRLRTLLQGDGKIVTVLSSYNVNNAASVTEEIRRWLPSGAPDTSWGESGVTTITQSRSLGTCDDAVFMPDGELLMSCASYGISRFLRIRRDGRPNTEFGQDGMVFTSNENNPFALPELLVPLPSGNWITLNNSSTGSVAVKVFASDGSLQNSRVWRLGEASSSFNDLVTDSNGDVVLVGNSYAGIESYFSLLKLQGEELAVSDWTNQLEPLNVSGDSQQFVTPTDALMVINEVNRAGSHILRQLTRHIQPSAYYDVNRDGWVTQQDALVVINYLNSAGAEREGVFSFPIVFDHLGDEWDRGDAEDEWDYDGLLFRW